MHWFSCIAYFHVAQEMLLGTQNTARPTNSIPGNPFWSRKAAKECEDVTVKRAAKVEVDTSENAFAGPCSIFHQCINVALSQVMYHSMSHSTMPIHCPNPLSQSAVPIHRPRPNQLLTGAVQALSDMHRSFPFTRSVLSHSIRSAFQFFLILLYNELL